MKRNTNQYRFDTPVVGTDPVTKGFFTIAWAYMTWDREDLMDDTDSNAPRAQGKIIIKSKDEGTLNFDNPLYKIAKESPLRLQGLVASVDFGAEKRFIRIESIKEFMIYPEMNGVEEIELNPVTFEILDNLGYFENLADYKWNNLLP